MRGYTFNINSGAIESLELDSFGISIIPSSLVGVLEVLLCNAASSKYIFISHIIWTTLSDMFPDLIWISIISGKYLRLAC